MKAAESPEHLVEPAGCIPPILTVQLWDNLGCQMKIENPRGFLLCAEKKIRGKDGSRAIPLSDQFFPDKSNMNKTVLLVWKEEREGRELAGIQLAEHR